MIIQMLLTIGVGMVIGAGAMATAIAIKVDDTYL
jgi:hypothetical protein